MKARGLTHSCACATYPRDKHTRARTSSAAIGSGSSTAAMISSPSLRMQQCVCDWVHACVCFPHEEHGHRIWRQSSSAQTNTHTLCRLQGLLHVHARDKHRHGRKHALATHTHAPRKDMNVEDLSLGPFGSLLTPVVIPAHVWVRLGVQLYGCRDGYIVAFVEAGGG